MVSFWSQRSPKRLHAMYNLWELLQTKPEGVAPRVFSWADWDSPPPPSSNFFSIPLFDTCPHFWTKACPPPPSQGSSPKIWEIQIYFCVKFDYFYAQKYLKKLYFMLNIAKNGLILLQSDLFCKSPPSDFVTDRDQQFWAPPSKI